MTVGAVEYDGIAVGLNVGRGEGWTVGKSDGRRVGRAVGFDGVAVGAGDGGNDSTAVI